MPGTFDPYSAWLEIPAAEQPPHHYRLLGVPLYEGNTTVITLAADRQISHLESLDDAEHGFLAQQLIKSIDAARTCLLDPKRKANYDTKLKSKAGGGPAQAADETPPPKSAPQSKPAPAPAPARSLPRAKPTADSSANISAGNASAGDASADSSGGGDALSFLSGPSGKRTSAVASSTAPRARPTPAGAPPGRPSDPRPANRADAKPEKKMSASRGAAIFIPTIVTAIILVGYAAYSMFGGGDDKKAKDAAKNKPAPKKTSSFDDLWAKEIGPTKSTPPSKPK